VPVDPSTAAGCRGFFSDQADALRIASHEDDLGSSPSELDRGGSPDAASSSREHDERHATDLTCARSPRLYTVDRQPRAGAAPRAPGSAQRRGDVHDHESRVPTAKRNRRVGGASLSVGNLVRTDRRDPEWWLARPEGLPADARRDLAHRRAPRTVTPVPGARCSRCCATSRRRGRPRRWLPVRTSGVREQESRRPARERGGGAMCLAHRGREGPHGAQVARGRVDRARRAGRVSADVVRSRTALFVPMRQRRRPVRTPVARPSRSDARSRDRW
jgi:hypothetical protein